MSTLDRVNQVILKDASNGSWLHFHQPLQVVCAWQVEEVCEALRQVEMQAEREGLYAAGWISYEAAPAFDPAHQVRPLSGFPYLWFGLYAAPAVINLQAVDDPQVLPRLKWSPSVGRQTYDAAITQVKEHIARGNTYQVNYTMRLRSPFEDDPWQLFLELVQAQQASYAAYIDTGDYVLCSASPELFFTLDGEHITVKPMKGTAARGRTLAEDEAQAKWLHHSEKNRAENVMIVDMIRNDLGRVARVGSVRWPKLFEIERYPTVWQMTSTVEAETQASLSEIMSKLFPCASITGAPKVRTMQIIAELETTPRRAYTGCIGFYAPPRASHRRRAQFNVAIRTILIERAAGLAEYGVGGGIVWDSTSTDEYEECLVKARVLTRRQPQFELLESLLWRPEGSEDEPANHPNGLNLSSSSAGFDDSGYFLLDGHLKRLGEAATYFQFQVDLEKVVERLVQATRGLPAIPHKIRLTAGRNGRLDCQAQPLSPPSAQPIRLRLAASAVDHANPFLYHKTTNRTAYEQALASVAGCDDAILWNERGELTETTIANLALMINDEWITPPVHCGLLGGVYRQWLLEMGIIQEGILHREALRTARKLAVFNSVRGWREAVMAEG